MSFIPYGRQNISNSDIEAVIQVLKSPFITQGPTVPLFEKSISDYVNSTYSVAVNSATSALHISCLALGLGKGDYLWTSSITFVASANCALYCGAKVDFVDIDINTGLLDINLLKEKLSKAKRENQLPKVIVPVHYAGSSCNMREIHQLSKEFGFKILEDASHAIGGKLYGEPVGNCRYSDICVFSFHPVKIITTAEGGVATTNNPYFARKMYELRSHGITKDPKLFKNLPSKPWIYEQQSLGFNYRLTEIQAALGLSQMQKLDNFVAERNRLWKLYKEKLEGLPISLLSIPEDIVSSLHLAVFFINTNEPGKHEFIFSKLREANIGVQVHYIPVHLQPFYSSIGFKKGYLPNSERFAERVISLPLFPGLKEEEQDYVVSELSKLFL